MTTLESALDQWKALVGPAFVLTEEALWEHFGPGTAPDRRHVLAAVLPDGVEAVQGVVAIANEHGIPLYPVSTGRNWGYGDFQPPLDGCVLVDLSRMNRILEVDRELGLVTVEPGVTQGDLAAYFDAEGLPFLVPVTGTGRRGSLIGNALERGQGGAPIFDHWLAISALQAVLPTGELYRTPMTELGAARVDGCYKWGVGPYLDGLFSQGGFGIVTQATIQVEPAPENVVYGTFQIVRDEQLEAAVGAMRSLLRLVGANVTAFSIQNAHRKLSLQIPYPRERARPQGGIATEVAIELAGGAAWYGAVGLFGPSEVVTAVRSIVERELAPHVQGLRFDDVMELEAMAVWLPMAQDSEEAKRASARIAELGQFGRPREVNNRTCYWYPGAKVPGADMDPARDGCGLEWYSPLMPLTPEDVRRHVDLVATTCLEHGMDPLIRVIFKSPRLAASPTPLVYDLSDPDAVRRAAKCHERLFEAGRQWGHLPPRAGVWEMSRFVDPDAVFWKTVGALSQALDPAGIMAPGRYAPFPSNP
jgi:4-cresol dehydrogenase (hydroxylating)